MPKNEIFTSAQKASQTTTFTIASSSWCACMMSTVSLSTRWDFQFRGSMVMRTCFGHFYTTSRMATSLRVPPPRIGGCNGQSSRPSRHRRTEVDARLTTTRRPERGTGGNVSIRLHLSLRRAVKIRSLELLLRHQMVRRPRTPIVEALFLPYSSRRRLDRVQLRRI